MISVQSGPIRTAPAARAAPRSAADRDSTAGLAAVPSARLAESSAEERWEAEGGHLHR